MSVSGSFVSCENGLANGHCSFGAAAIGVHVQMLNAILYILIIIDIILFKCYLQFIYYLYNNIVCLALLCVKLGIESIIVWKILAY